MSDNVVDEVIGEDEIRFNFDSWVREARLGYTELCAQKRTLDERIAADTAERGKVEESIQKLGAMLASMGVTPEESLSRPRQMNVTATTQEVVQEVFRDPSVMNVPEADLIAKVVERLPYANRKSIANSLYRMSQSGALVRSGKRGSFTYTVQIEVGAGAFPAQKVIEAGGGFPAGKVNALFAATTPIQNEVKSSEA